MLCVRNPASGLLQIGHKLEKWQWHVTICWHDVIIKFSWRCFVFLVKFSYWSKFHVNIVTGLELWQFSFTRDEPEIRKLEITPSEFCPISGERGELGIPNLARVFLMKCYRMVQNAKVTALQLLLLLVKLLQNL